MIGLNVDTAEYSPSTCVYVCVYKYYVYANCVYVCENVCMNVHMHHVCVCMYACVPAFKKKEKKKYCLSLFLPRYNLFESTFRHCHFNHVCLLFIPVNNSPRYDLSG